MARYFDACFRNAVMIVVFAATNIGEVHAQSPAQDLQALITRGRDLASQPNPDRNGMAAIVGECVRVARAADASGDTATVKNAWNAVIGGLDIAGEAIAESQQHKIRIVAAQGLRDAGEAHDAIVAVRPVLGASNAHDVASAERLLLQIGSAHYQSAGYRVARMAWQPLVDRKQGHATASLGLAWLTLAERPDEHEAIAAAMMGFAKQHESHPDALAAMQQAALHFAKAELNEKAIDTFLEGMRLSQQQDVELSEEAVDAIVALKSDLSRLLPLAKWLCQEPGRLTSAQRAVFAARLLQQDPAAFETAVDGLIRLDQDASMTRSLINGVGGVLVAPLVVARLGDSDVGVGSKLAAVQWLAKEGQWLSIATAAEISPGQLAGHGPAHAKLTRLIAESFTRTLNQQKSHDWWLHVVDELGDETFVSKLRLAECAVQIESVDQARRRINDAKAVAAEKPAQIALVQFLSADVAIRAVRFEEARQTLESVIRNVAVTTELRARAQFMLGETHYQQENFAAAIAAYRLVEGMTPDSDWAAASLVQAGKSFERLGRTQSAAVCYGNLMSRFADSEHTKFARQRVAALSPDARPNPHPSDPILRR